MNSATPNTLKKVIAIGALFCMTTQTTFGALLNLSQQPLMVGANVPPKVMLTISKDQQLYKKAYNDYSDLDGDMPGGDKAIETTYKHSINYYGYFDSTKCYNYSAANQRFEPAALADAAKYCAGQWSGNFLNWLAMSRMDAIRKLLYGGMRSTDQTTPFGASPAVAAANVTVLERSYLPTDAHAWAKYYDGADINKLTPFAVPATPTTYNAITLPFNIPNTNGDYPVVFAASQAANIGVGDQVRLERGTGNSGQFVIGTVVSITAGITVTLRINTAATRGSGIDTSWKVTNLSRAGISFCNLTPGSSSGADSRSSTNSQPPLIRVARGNFALWNSAEAIQCQWSESRANTQAGFPGGLRSNGNQLALSEMAASAENPSQAAHGLGTGSAVGEYVARVRVCVSGLIGDEKCSLYPRGNFKPVGLLQEYGDRDLIHFGLMTGSHIKNISGGVLRKNVGSIATGAGAEINVNSDGTFIRPYRPSGSPRNMSSAAEPAGIINTLNYMRIYGYDYSNGTYIGGNGDNCTYQLTNITENGCTSWGNPMSEVYFESVRYFAGGSPTPAYNYTGASRDNELGLPIVPAASWNSGLAASTYCASLNIIAFNASVSTNETDLGTTPSSQIGGAAATTISALTNKVGDAEAITNGRYFIGKMLGAAATPAADPGFELCTPKTVSALGDVSGICPEGPTTAGSDLIAGVAHHAKTNRIRSDIPVPATNQQALKVTTYGIQLSTNTPTITIPIPGAAAGQNIVIQPIYRLRLPDGTVGGGALVDMKFVRQSTVGNISTGKIYVNWEDSEQGGDYDQDMWGTLEWTLNGTTRQLKITTNAISASSINGQGFGYAISGTTPATDGPHFHSGIYGFNFTDPTGLLGCTNCRLVTEGVAGSQTGEQSITYNGVTGTAGGALKDPLWYAAKYGGFVDRNNNGLPDNTGAGGKPDTTEWDVRKADGSAGSDGIPDNYFLVSNPLGLEQALSRAFLNILNTSAFTSVAANSTSLRSLSSVYQASFISDDWHGKLEKFDILPDGSVNRAAKWDAGDRLLNTILPGNRKIITFDDTAGVKDGVPFRWGQIPATLTAALNRSPDSGIVDGRGQDRLNWLRGDTTLGNDPTTGFRERRFGLLGDIVNSDPVFVGPPNSIILDPTYVSWRDRAAIAGRAPMLYVGANDGMLHGFDAKEGDEKIAYVPSKTFPNLARLTSSSYSHRFYVDGTPEVADAQIGGTTADNWKTVLVGGLGLGGQGIYALDVTDPNFSEASARSTVLWEFNDTDDKDLGYVTGKPLIRKVAHPTAGSKWAVIISGGYNNSEGDSAASLTGRAYLFVIFLDGPGPGRIWRENIDYVKIDTTVGSVGTPNGLAPPLAVDANRDGRTDYVYAGDLQGNMWKFDISSPNFGLWKDPSRILRLFQAKEGTAPLALVQAITARADAIPHPTGRGYVVLFGTGKYLEINDRVAPHGLETFYGIWDKDDRRGGAIRDQTKVDNRDQLLRQTIVNQAGASGVEGRIVSNTSIVWSTDTTPPTADDSGPRHMGWFMDFPLSTTTGERVVFRPLVLGGRLIFTTLIPSAGLCDAGGSSYLMVVNPATGARFDETVIDITGDGLLNAGDQLGGTYASGLKTGITPTPTIVVGDSGAPGTRDSRAFIKDDDRKVPLKDPTGRVTWREVLGK